MAGLLTGKIRLAGLWEQEGRACLLSAGISALATFGYILLPPPTKNTTQHNKKISLSFSAERCSTSCSVKCGHGEAHPLVPRVRAPGPSGSPRRGPGSWPRNAPASEVHPGPGWGPTRSVIGPGVPEECGPKGEEWTFHSAL